MELSALHIIKVDVHIQPPARSGNMDTASDKFLVSD